MTCTACYGKRRHSVLTTKELRPGYKVEAVIVVDCSRCRGTGVEPSHKTREQPRA